MADTAVAYRGTGKRKTSVARVVLVPGAGVVTVRIGADGVAIVMSSGNGASAPSSSSDDSARRNSSAL